MSAPTLRPSAIDVTHPALALAVGDRNDGDDRQLSGGGGHCVARRIRPDLVERQPIYFALVILLPWRSFLRSNHRRHAILFARGVLVLTVTWLVVCASMAGGLILPREELALFLFGGALTAVPLSMMLWFMAQRT